MSLGTARAKEDRVVVKKEEDSTYEEAEDVKNSACLCVSEAAILAGLYTDHVIKDELVLGPESVQRPAQTYVPSSAPEALAGAREGSGARGAEAWRHCSVRLERMPSLEALVNGNGTETDLHELAQGAGKKQASSQEVVLKVEPATRHVQDCPNGDASATGSTDTRDTETNPYTCDKCGQQFKELYFYIPHMQLHEHNMEIVEESVTKQTKFPCDTCGKVYPSKSGLYHHQQKHFCARFSCKYCDKQFTMHCYLKKHERIHTKPYSCDICKKQFAEPSALMTHKRIHTGEKPFSCEICDKKFAHLSDLAKHKRIHTGEKPYACEVCKKQFRCASHLVMHRKVHSDDKPHSCDTCKKQFADVASLTVHKRVHTGEKPFSCEVCNKKFTRNSSLITHRQQHTRGGFSCDVCKKQLTQLGNLRKHNKAQHPEVCA